MPIFSRADKFLFGLFAVIVILFGVSVYLSNNSAEEQSDEIQSRSDGSYAIKIEKEKPFSVALVSDPVAYFTKCLFVATALLTLFTAGLAVVTIMIWLDGKETSRKQHVAARRSLIHAARSAKAAENAVLAASLASQTQLRAYVSVSKFAISPMINKSGVVQGCQISIVFENTGQTPTKDLVIHVSVRFQNEILPPDFRFPDTWIVGRPRTYTPLTIFPRGEFSDGNFPISVDQMIQIQKNEMFMYIYGYADYNDVFESTERHRTEFCAQLNIIGDPSQPSDTNLAFNTYYEHNGADQECMRTPIPLSVGRRKIFPI